MRAGIRAQVTAVRLSHASEPERPAIAKIARAYFDLATGTIAPPAPRLISIGGLSGTGKSALARSLARGLAPAPGAVVLRSDVERKALFGLAETDRLGVDAYHADVTTRVYSALADKAQLG